MNDLQLYRWNDVNIIYQLVTEVSVIIDEYNFIAEKVKIIKNQ
jgi:hypothetical protein